MVKEAGAVKEGVRLLLASVPSENRSSLFNLLPPLVHEEGNFHDTELKVSYSEVSYSKPLRAGDLPETTPGGDTSGQWQKADMGYLPHVCSPELLNQDILSAERGQRFLVIVRGRTLVVMDFHPHSDPLEPEDTVGSVQRPKQITLGSDTSDNSSGRISRNHDEPAVRREGTTHHSPLCSDWGDEDFCLHSWAEGNVTGPGGGAGSAV